MILTQTDTEPLPAHDLELRFSALLRHLTDDGWDVLFRLEVDPKPPKYSARLVNRLWRGREVVGRCDTLELALSNAVRLAKDKGWL